MGPSCYTLATHPNGWKKDNLENKHAVSTVHNTRIIQLLVVLGFPTYRKSHSITARPGDRDILQYLILGWKIHQATHSAHVKKCQAASYRARNCR
jgi:hypothetical protein